MRDKGGFAVLKTALALVEGGLCVLSPNSDNMRYDLATECGGRLARIQVKSRHLKKDGTVRLELWSNTHNRAKRFYTMAEIDFIALYCPDTNEIYWLPMAELEGLRQVRIRVEGDVRHSSSIRYAYAYTIDNLKRWFDGKTC